jgi:hypothetical protein
MPDVAKGGIFVAAAVATGLLAGLLLPSWIGAAPETPRKRTAAHVPSYPTMPSVVGRSLDEADGELRRREITYETDAPGIVEDTLPELLEVCESEPGAGSDVRGSVHLQTAIRGTCGI